MIEKAKKLAEQAHEGQFRKWSNPLQKYIVHPERVANKVAALNGVTEVDIAAAYLHDVIEDCGEHWAEDILVECGQEVLDLVRELTFPTEGEAWAGRPRAEKNVIRFQQMRAMTSRAQRIKMVDRWDNLHDMTNAPRKLIHKMVDESWVLLEICQNADEVMARQLKNAIQHMEKRG